MKKYNILAKYISVIQWESIGEWFTDKEINEALEHLIQIPYVDYSQIVDNFIDRLYGVNRKHKENYNGTNSR